MRVMDVSLLDRPEWNDDILIKKITPNLNRK